MEPATPTFDVTTTQVVLSLVAAFVVSLVGKAAMSWFSKVSAAVSEIALLRDTVDRLEGKDMEHITRRLDKMESDMGDLRSDIGDLKTDVGITKSQTAATMETVSRIEDVMKTVASNLARRN